MANYKMVIEDNAGNGYLPAPGLPTKTEAQLNAENRVLLLGEMVQESDTKLIKIGDGVKTYSALPYFDISEGQITSGWGQEIAAYSFKRRLPGGIKIQGGFVGVVSAANGVWITFLEAYAAVPLTVIACSKLNNSNVWVTNVANNKFACLVSADTDIFWLAIGV